MTPTTPVEHLGGSDRRPDGADAGRDLRPGTADRARAGRRLRRASAETSPRLSSNASLVVVCEGSDGSPWDVGRRTRTIPRSIRPALAARDARCRFPGCTARRCDAHIGHRADGGPTWLDNLMLLCRRHHTLVQEGGLIVERDVLGAVTFVSPDGGVIDQAPRPPVGIVRPLTQVAGARSPRTRPFWKYSPGRATFPQFQRTDDSRAVGEREP
jgi:hypothetical protein